MANEDDRFDSYNETIDTSIPFKLSSIDERILELNRQGHSQAEISRRLKSYGIELSKGGVHRHLKELRQDPDNSVKTNKCNYQKPREETREYKIIDRLKKEMSEYKELQGFDPSFRTMAYQLQDLKLITAKEVGWLNHCTVEARLRWVDADGNLLYPKLDIDCFPDDSRKVLGHRDDSPPNRGSPATAPEDPDEYIDDYIQHLLHAPSEYDGKGGWGTADQVGGRWHGQPEVVEVWDEKNDLLNGFHKLLEGKSVKVRANKGWSSLEFLYRCTEELKELLERFEPEHIHIKYCGDWDPSGREMDDYIKRRLRQLGIAGIDFKRIAVTPDQIRKYGLPKMDIEPESGKKPNPKLKEFKRLYGDAATHLNAFFTKKNIGGFKEIIIKEVDQHWDQSIYDDMVEDYSEEAEEPYRYSKRELKQIHRNMYEKITNAFTPGWYSDYLEAADDSDEEEDDDHEE